MEKLLNSYIKDIIDEYPGVADILEEYNIGCAPCNVGTCLLKDIIDIHNLSEDDEHLIMARIAGIIYPDKKIDIPKTKLKTKPSDIKYSPPMKILVDEHRFIKRLLALIPDLVKELAVNPKNGREFAKKSIDFIRSYADKFHHAKEEDILFKYFDEGLDILKVMHEEHEMGRAHVRAIMEGLEKQDDISIKEHIESYKELLTEHIKKEDEILYPWLDRNLTTSQIGELFSKFNEVRKRFGDQHKKYENFIHDIEQKFKPKEVEK